MTAARAARAAAAAVWWYQGPWCKILRPRADHRSIVAAVPGLPAGWVTGALVGIGAAEAVLGAWALSGVRARQAALAQTALLIGVNAGGLAFAPARIAEPGRMLARNAALLALVWLPARRATDD